MKSNNAIKDFIKAEFSGWSKFEKILVPLILVVVTSLSISANDTKVATIHAIFGILATRIVFRLSSNHFISSLTESSQIILICLLFCISLATLK